MYWKLAVNAFSWRVSKHEPRLLTAAASNNHLNVYCCIFLNDLERQVVTLV